MTKYLVNGPFPVCDVQPGGLVDGDLIPNVELLLEACAISEIKSPNKTEKVESDNG
jgi:hypothetical protein